MKCISVKDELIRGKHGYLIKPDLSVDEVDPGQFNGVIIPGGTNNPDYLRRRKQVLDFVKTIHDGKKLVAAICHGGWVLISAKILSGRKATSFYAIKDDMINAGAIFEEVPVIRDKNLITSRSPIDLPVLLREILRYLESAQITYQ